MFAGARAVNTRRRKSVVAKEATAAAAVVEMPEVRVDGDDMSNALNEEQAGGAAAATTAVGLSVNEANAIGLQDEEAAAEVSILENEKTFSLAALRAVREQRSNAEAPTTSAAAAAATGAPSQRQQTAAAAADSDDSSEFYSDEYTLSESTSGSDLSFREHSVDSALEQSFNLQALKAFKAQNRRRATNATAAVGAVASAAVNIAATASVSNNTVGARRRATNATATVGAGANAAVGVGAATDSAAIESVLIHTVSANVSMSRPLVVTALEVKLEPLSAPEDATKTHSIKEGCRTFDWLIAPVAVSDFFANNWQKKVLVVKRPKCENYYRRLLSIAAIDRMLIDNHLDFSKNIDISAFRAGMTEVVSPEGRALPPAIWEHYSRGFSVRLHNLQSYVPPLTELSANLQEYFHSPMAAHACITPLSRQGFAPDYDEFDSFVLQIEGSSRWRLHKPHEQCKLLPYADSKKMYKEEFTESLLYIALQAGDLLYFPRGTLHEACADPESHSLHITLHAHQLQTYANLLEQMMPVLLKSSIQDNIELRRALPLNIWQHLGIANMHIETATRMELQQTVKQLIGEVLSSNMLPQLLDNAVDQLAKKFQRAALPPHLLSAERARTILAANNIITATGACACDYELHLSTKIRLLRANIVRLVQEESQMRLYYYVDNTRQHNAVGPQYMQIAMSDVQAVNALMQNYPSYVSVAELPFERNEHKKVFATSLFERGVIMLEQTFN